VIDPRKVPAAGEAVNDGWQMPLLHRKARRLRRRARPGRVKFYPESGNFPANRRSFLVYQK
jgi:hypothetical protein